MKDIQRIGLIHELDTYLTSKGYRITKEVEYKDIMDTKRKFRADYLLDNSVMIEINGGQFKSGRHNRGGAGYETDLHKINLAQSRGYKVYQFTYEMLERREYLELL